MEGFDLEAIKKITEAVTIPVVACGGAGHTKDLERNAYVLRSTDIFAKHDFEDKLKKPLQEDRYFVFFP